MALCVKDTMLQMGISVTEPKKLLALKPPLPPLQQERLQQPGPPQPPPQEPPHEPPQEPPQPPQLFQPEPPMQLLFKRQQEGAAPMRVISLTTLSSTKAKTPVKPAPEMPPDVVKMVTVLPRKRAMSIDNSGLSMIFLPPFQETRDVSAFPFVS